MPGVGSSRKAARSCKTIWRCQKTFYCQIAWGETLSWSIMALCCWTQAKVGGFSVSAFIRRWINVQYTSFSYLEKPVMDMKEGKSVARSRDSKGSTSVRRDKWWDQWAEGNSTLAEGWSLFLSFEMSSLFLFLCSFHGLHVFSQCCSPIYLVYPLIPPWILVSLLQCSLPQHLLHEIENNNVQLRCCFSDGGIEVILRWEIILLLQGTDC